MKYLKPTSKNKQFIVTCNRTGENIPVTARIVGTQQTKTDIDLTYTCYGIVECPLLENKTTNMCPDCTAISEINKQL